MMMPEEVLANLENYSLWEYGDYKLSRSETECVIDSLKKLIAIKQLWKSKKGADNEPSK